MDLSWSELLVVGIVALIIIGPKDLPGMFRELGRIMAKVRAMGREFSRAMEQAAKETGVKDVADDLRKVASPKSMGLDAVKSAADKFEKWDPLKGATTAKPSTPTPAPATTAAATATAATTAGTAATTAASAAPAAVGPATAALAADMASKKAAATEKAAALREARVAPAETDAAPAAVRGGRVRKKPETGTTGDAE